MSENDSDCGQSSRQSPWQRQKTLGQNGQDRWTTRCIMSSHSFAWNGTREKPFDQEGFMGWNLLNLLWGYAPADAQPIQSFIRRLMWSSWLSNLNYSIKSGWIKESKYISSGWRKRKWYEQFLAVLGLTGTRQLQDPSTFLGGTFLFNATLSLDGDVTLLFVLAASISGMTQLRLSRISVLQEDAVS